MNLFERFEVLEDSRDIRGKRYKLIDIITMTIYGLLCELTDFTNIVDFMKLKEDYFKELLKQIKQQFKVYNNLYGNEEIKYKKTVEKDHGRGEIREYFLIYNTSKIVDKNKWKTVKCKSTDTR